MKKIYKCDDCEEWKSEKEIYQIKFVGGAVLHGLLVQIQCKKCHKEEEGEK